MRRKNSLKTQEKLISQIKEKYRDLISCDFIDYKGTHTKIKLKCNKCGSLFEKTPRDILYISNKENICPFCYKEKQYKKYKKDFFDKATKIHNGKYDYSKAEYINSKAKICIICPIHGEFWQIPNSHLNGHGCPCCKHDKSRLTIEDFLEKARKIHKDYYSYDKNINYVNNHTPISVICPKHGQFSIEPRQHLKGSGCPKCRKSWLEQEIMEFLEKNNIYYIKEQSFEWLKNKHHNLYLDFYLPKYNIAIECQGEQHFRPIPFYGGEEKFKKVLENDLLKIKLCSKHNIKIIHKSNFKNCNKETKNKWEKYQIILDNNEILTEIEREKNENVKEK